MTTTPHTTSHCYDLRRGGAVLALLLLLLGCSAVPASPSGSDQAPAAAPGTGQPTLSEEQLAGCSKVLTQVRQHPREDYVIDDRTRSVADRVLSQDLSDELVAASEADAGLTVVTVSGGPQKMLVHHGSLSVDVGTDRNVDDIHSLARAMPSCVDEVYLKTVAPQTVGTDLYGSLAGVAEEARAGDQVWLLSDFLSNSGQLKLTKELLVLKPADAATAAAVRAPLDLHGATLHLEGIANTATALPEADRVWLRDFATGLCRAWKATGCDDVRLVPANAGRTGADHLPSDPPVPFPTVTQTGCTYTLPGQITFADESATLQPDVAKLLQAPIRVLTDNPASKARIVGHTATVRPDRHTGYGLSRQRAAAVKGVFVAQGIAGSRLATRGVGDSDPAEEDWNPRAHRQIEAAARRERRVTITIEGAPCPRT